jgi:hypothetical protein
MLSHQKGILFRVVSPEGESHSILSHQKGNLIPVSHSALSQSKKSVKVGKSSKDIMSLCSENVELVIAFMTSNTMFNASNDSDLAHSFGF